MSRFFSKIAIPYSSDYSINNITFANCKVINECGIRGTSTIQFINSYLEGFTTGSDGTASLLNCIIQPLNGNPSTIRKCQLINCIIRQKGSSYQNTSINSSSLATNCVAIGYAKLFESSPANTGCNTSTYEELFKTYSGVYSDTENFALTDVAKSKYLGTDGKEVGMYGGVLPYTSTPSYPQITKMNVANKTTADGKLSVEIEVGAAQ